MKHLIIFGIILLGVILLTLTYQCKFEGMTNSQLGNCSNIDIYLKLSELGGKYGRGVFTNRNFEPNDIIELAPYIEDINENFKGVIRDYIFNKNKEQTIAIIAFGFGSMYNHSDEPNAHWEIDDKYVKIKCIKPIKKDEEVFISYGDQYWKTREKLEKIEKK